MRIEPWIVMGAMVACGPSSVGSWTGTCVIDDAEVAEDYQFEALDLQVEAGALTGTTTVLANWQLEPFEGTVTGTQQGDQLELDAVLGDVTQGFEMTLAGTVDADRIDGTCTATVSTVVSGTLTLNQATQQ